MFSRLCDKIKSPRLVAMNKRKPEKLKPLPRTNVIVVGLLLVVCILLVSSARLGADLNQTRDPVHDSSGKVPSRNSPVPDRIFVATLAKSLDVKRLKAGDRLLATGFDPQSVTAQPILFSGEILQAYTLKSGRTESLISIRFDKLKFGVDQERSVNLALRALVSSETLNAPAPLIIPDRYPCDYDADPKGCDEKSRTQDRTWQADVGKISQIVCRKAMKPGGGQPDDECVSLSNASGVYGFPDLSIGPPSGDTPREFSITSHEKNVYLASGTIFVLFGSGNIPPRKP
jgi:hypothetical protein